MRALRIKSTFVYAAAPEARRSGAGYNPYLMMVSAGRNYTLVDESG
jgi:hypothetical protein